MTVGATAAGADETLAGDTDRLVVWLILLRAAIATDRTGWLGTGLLSLSTEADLTAGSGRPIDNLDERLIAETLLGRDPDGRDLTLWGDLGD